jgi:hypothetical protein
MLDNRCNPGLLSTRVKQNFRIEVQGKHEIAFAPRLEPFQFGKIQHPIGQFHNPLYGP